MASGHGKGMLKGKCALITGSVAGLGHTMARELARAGANVVINGLCEPGEGRRVAEALARSNGVDAVFDPADLRHRDDIERMIASAEARFGTVDILVNNAVVRHFSPIEAFSPENWDASIAVNLTAPFNAVRLVLPGMKERGWGRIVNITSYYGWRGADGRIDYVTTKTALIGMTRAIAIEAARSGVTCNAICPGSVLTPAIHARIEGLAENQGRPIEDVAREYAEARSPVGRFVPQEDVAAMLVYLCGPASANITGTVLPVDGGWLAS